MLYSNRCLVMHNLPDVELLTILRNRFTILYRTLVRERGYGMSTQELELVKIIYENENPERAVLTAIKTFAAFLEQLAEDPEPPSVCPLESA